MSGAGETVTGGCAEAILGREDQTAADAAARGSERSSGDGAAAAS